jgi:formate hydrogenlyase transcriptional activator
MDLTSPTSSGGRARSDQELLLELERKNSQLNLLLDLTNSLASNLDLNQVLQAVCANIRRLMQCDVMAILEVVPELDQLSVLALDFPSSRLIDPDQLNLVPTSSIADRIFRTGQPTILRGHEIEASGDLMAVVEGLKSVVLLPLISKTRKLGTLGWGVRSEREYATEDLAFLTQVANQVALALDYTLAYRELTELKEKLTREKLYLEDEIRTEMHFDEIIGSSESLRQVLQLVETVAPSDSTVLRLPCSRHRVGLSPGWRPC